MQAIATTPIFVCDKNVVNMVKDRKHSTQAMKHSKFTLNVFIQYKTHYTSLHLNFYLLVNKKYVKPPPTPLAILYRKDVLKQGTLLRSFPNITF
jgi:hypothetical protein